MKRQKSASWWCAVGACWPIFSVLLIALVVNFGLAAKLGMGKPMVSDAGYFLEAAQSLAEGRGYTVQESFWPGEPSMRRFPGWPFVVSLALRAMPEVSPDTVMRCVALCVNAAAAVAIAWLTLLLFGGRGPGELNHGLHGCHGLGSATSGDCCVDSRGTLPSGISATGGLNGEGMGDGGLRTTDYRLPTDSHGLQPPVSSLQSSPKGLWSKVCSLWSVVCRLPAMAAAIAGLVYAFYPAALFNAYTGLSEPLFILVVAAGAIALVKGNGVSERSADSEHVEGPSVFRPKVYGLQSTVYSLLGLALLGCAVLIRGNFLLWLPIVGLLTAAMWGVGRFGGRRTEVGGQRTEDGGQRTEDGGRRAEGAAAEERKSTVYGLRSMVCALAVLLFLLPSTLWSIRNYRVCGHFPVISTLGGQVLYGGNNEVVANDLQWWGYWVFPDKIPNEITMREQAKTMSEYEVDQYNKEKGVTYIRENWFAMPRLLLGKMIRAYVPMPWRPRWGSYAVAGYRWMLILGVVIGLVVAWHKTPPVYRLILGAMVLTNLATVLTFYGSTRFAFALEPFLLPFFGVGIVHVLMGRRVKPRMDTN